MEWTVVTVVIALLGLVVTVLALSDKIKKPIEKLNGSIIRLDTTMMLFQEQFKDNKKCNDEEHAAIWDRIDGDEKSLIDHETRITVLEQHTT